MISACDANGVGFVQAQDVAGFEGGGGFWIGLLLAIDLDASLLDEAADVAAGPGLAEEVVGGFDH